MPPSFHLQHLTPADHALLAPLLNLFSDAFDEPEVYRAQRPSPAYLQRLLASDTALAFVALQQGEVVGGLTAYVWPKFEQERSEIYLYDLAVAASHRRQGIATALIQALQQHAVAIGAYLIMVQTYRDDTEAVALYTKFAAPEDVLHFELREGA